MREVEIVVSYKVITYDDTDREEIRDEVIRELPGEFAIYDELNDIDYTARRESIDIKVEGDENT